MNDTHQTDDGNDDTYGNLAGRHPADVLGDLDPADAPQAAEQFADRLAEELESPRDKPLETAEPEQQSFGEPDPGTE